MTPLTTVIIPVFIGIVATLLTIFLTPALQHYFWVQKRREELRLGVIDEINGLLSDYITKHIDCTNRGASYDPPVSFFASLRVADAKLRVLFSDDTFRVYKQAEVMIAHGTLGPGGTIEKFVAAGDSARHVRRGGTTPGDGRSSSEMGKTVARAQMIAVEDPWRGRSA